VDDSIYDLLQKLKNLSERGEQGEAVLAQEKLEALMEKYGVTEDDLLNRDKRKYTFSYGTRWERTLLIQIVAWSTKTSTIYSAKPYPRARKMVFELTELQNKEVSSAFVYYKDLFHKEIDSFMYVFIQKHELCSGESTNLLDEEDWIILMKKMGVMKESEFEQEQKKLSIAKQIE